MKSINSLLLAAIAATTLQTAIASEKPPPGAMALSMVLTKLEQQGFTPIVEVDLERGRWKVEAYKGDQKYDLEVDPNSAEILSNKPDNS
ncbi:PepSY domain-containing protein [Microbulbifer echini]|uniref:PepSY domain-containing protein n=1 Tax=Microbulbifer echini TaxID=1529067 RepID=A0ABV4NK32_9GAMM|nr:PepSY domain-containing protein [uncultured Microbulbifer sp.]